MAHDSSGSAFPTPNAYVPEEWVHDPGFTYGQDGLTRLQWMAALFVQGMLASGAFPSPYVENYERARTHLLQAAIDIAGELIVRTSC